MADKRISALASLLLCSGLATAAKKETTSFKSYVDSDICSHVYAGPLTQKRIECSEQTHKEGSNPVLVRLKDSWIFEVNKEKMVKKHVGKLVTAEGEVNYNDSTMKLTSVNPLDAASIPSGEKERTLLDVRQSKAQPQLQEKIRHELAMMPYVSYFDFISFTLNGNNVTLTGWTTRPTNRSEAFNRVRQIEGVERIINNLEVTPVSPMDNQIRAAALISLQQNLSRYFWGSGSDIKIIVKNGDIILLGSVASKGDSDIANLRCATIPTAFHVFNMLRITQSEGKSAKEKGD